MSGIAGGVDRRMHRAVSRCRRCLSGFGCRGYRSPGSSAGRCRGCLYGRVARRSGRPQRMADGRRIDTRGRGYPRISDGAEPDLGGSLIYDSKRCDNNGCDDDTFHKSDFETISSQPGICYPLFRRYFIRFSNSLDFKCSGAIVGIFRNQSSAMRLFFSWA